MNQFLHQKNFSNKPPVENSRQLLPLLQKLKEVYLIWFQSYQILPKTHRYTLGQYVDRALVESIEATATGAFLAKTEKLPFVGLAIKKVELIKLLLMILWEAGSLGDKEYVNLSEKIFAIGQMLGGWRGQLIKQNSPAKAREK